MVLTFDYNPTALLQRLARVFKFSNIASRSIMLSRQRATQGADQIVRMHRLIRAFVARIWHKTDLFMTRLTSPSSNLCCKISHIVNLKDGNKIENRREFAIVIF